MTRLLHVFARRLGEEGQGSEKEAAAGFQVSQPLAFSRSQPPALPLTHIPTVSLHKRAKAVS